MNKIKMIWNWFKPMLLMTILVAIAGFADANRDTVAFHWSVSIHQDILPETYANPSVSWINKWWKDKETGEYVVGKEKFPGSSTVFVAFTDFWHLMQMIVLACFFLAITLKKHKRNKWWEYLIEYIILYAAFTMTFTLFFSFLLVKRKKGE